MKETARKDRENVSLGKRRLFYQLSIKCYVWILAFPYICSAGRFTSVSLTSTFHLAPWWCGLLPRPTPPNTHPPLKSSFPVGSWPDWRKDTARSLLGFWLGSLLKPAWTDPYPSKTSRTSPTCGAAPSRTWAGAFYFSLWSTRAVAETRSRSPNNGTLLATLAFRHVCVWVCVRASQASGLHQGLLADRETTVCIYVCECAQKRRAH